MAKKTTQDNSDKVSTVLPKDTANPLLVRKLQGAVNESALRDFLKESASMILDGSVSVRGWNASIEEANTSVGFKPSWGSYVVRSFMLSSVQGSEKFSVSVLFNTAISASKNVPALRAPNKKGEAQFSLDLFKARIARANAEGTTFAELCAEWDKATSKKPKPNKETGAEGGAIVKPAESVEEVVEVAKSVAVTADSVVALALGLLEGLEGEAATIRDRASSARLVETLKILSTPSHPAVKSKASA